MESKKILVIDRAGSPEVEGIPAENRIWDMVYLLKKPFECEFVYSLSGHDFEDFEKFRADCEKKFEEEYGEDSGVPPYEYLRRKPIKSPEDLMEYDGIFAHIMGEGIEMLKEVRNRRPGVPIIMPGYKGMQIREHEQFLYPDIRKMVDGTYLIAHGKMEWFGQGLLEHLILGEN